MTKGFLEQYGTMQSTPNESLAPDSRSERWKHLRRLDVSRRPISAQQLPYLPGHALTSVSLGIQFSTFASPFVNCRSCERGHHSIRNRSGLWRCHTSPLLRLHLSAQDTRNRSIRNPSSSHPRCKCIPCSSIGIGGRRSHLSPRRYESQR